MKLPELTSLLASSDPADRLQGLQALDELRAAAQVPVAIHLVHASHPAARETLLARVAAHGKQATAAALGQLLESDAPHPESALFYLSLAGDPAYNGLLLSMLPQCAEPIQVGILQVLSRTADESALIALAGLEPHLAGAARQAMARFAGRPAAAGRSGRPAELSDSYVNFTLEQPTHRGKGSEKVGASGAQPTRPEPGAGFDKLSPSGSSTDQPEPGAGFDRFSASGSVSDRPEPQARVGTSLRERIARRQEQRRISAWMERGKLAVVEAGGLLTWTAATALLTRAAWESWHLAGPLSWVTPLGLALALVATAVSWRRFTHVDRAALAGITLAACAAFSALQAPPTEPSGFALFGRDAGFWGNLLSLASIALVAGATLAQREWPRMARLASIALCAYTALGFVRALAIGAPLEVALLGGAHLPEIGSALLQPPVAFVNVLLPAAMLMAALHAARGWGAPGLRGPAGAFAFLAVPLAACSFVLETHLLPTPRSLLLGTSPAGGFAGVDYTSDWLVSEEGSGKHRIEIATRGNSRRRAYELAAKVSPAPVAGKSTEVLVSVRDARLGLPISGLRPGDLEIFEDGEKQAVSSLEPVGGDPAAYRLRYTRALPPMASVRLTSPASGTVTRVLNVVAETDHPASRIDLFVDDEPIGTCDKGPARVAEPAEAFSAGKHVVRAVVRDRFGRSSEDRREVTIQHSLPDLAILQPSEGGALWGDAKLEASVAGIAARRVDLVMDSTVLKTFAGAGEPVQLATADPDGAVLPADASVRTEGAARIYTARFNSRAMPEGLHRFGLRLMTADGRTLERRVTARIVRPMVAVRFVTPGYRSRLSGKVPLLAEAVCSWPELGIARMEFTANGKRLGLVDRAPYAFEWDTSGWAPGRYRLDAVAASSNGEVGSAAVFVEVARPEAAVALDGLYDGAKIFSALQMRAVAYGPAAGRIKRMECRVAGELLAQGAAGPLTVRLDPSGRPDGETAVTVEAVLEDGKKISRSYRIHMAATQGPRATLAATAHGAPVELPAEPPELSVDGRVATGVALRKAAERPSSIALVVDVSASMAGTQRRTHLESAIGRFVHALGADDRVALYTVNDEVSLAQPFTTDRDAITGGLAAARAYGATATNDAVFRAAEALGHERGRRIVVLFTDGFDQNIDWTGPASSRLLPQSIAAARAAGVAVHVVGIGREMRQEAGLAERLASRLASETGGLYQYAPWPRDLPAVVAGLTRHLQSELELSWDAPDAWGERSHTLSARWPTHPDRAARLSPSRYGL